MANMTATASEGIELTCGMSGRHRFIFTLVPVVYGFNFVIGVVGNSMVVAVIYRYMKLKAVANIFVLNLAISDLTFLITLVGITVRCPDDPHPNPTTLEECTV